jgi:hypothetical protein
MSSWLQNGVRKRIRLGYHQEKPLGNFIKKDKPATVITAYSDMKSKYDPQKYRNWIRIFLEACDCHLIFFTDNKEIGSLVWEYRKDLKDRTKVILFPKTEWTANKNFSEAFWERQHEKDPEKNIHSVELYKVWYEKKEFIKRAIELNPWGHTDFVWADAGICRDPKMAPLLKNFPVADRIPTDRILMLNIGEFTENDSVIREINGVKITGGNASGMRISAGVIAGSVDAWKKYDEAYEKVLDKYIESGFFCGKEQNIMATLVLENRNLVSLVEPHLIFSDFWRYMLLWLSAPNLLFERMNHEIQRRKTLSFEDMYEYLD